MANKNGPNQLYWNAGGFIFPVPVWDSDDIDDNLRNDGSPDIGAYEYSNALSVNDFEIPNINVFPNPVSENLYIVSSGKNIVSIKINDASGKQIISKDYLNNTLSIASFNKLKRGLYFVKVNTIYGAKIFIVVKD